MSAFPDMFPDGLLFTLIQWLQALSAIIWTPESRTFWAYWLSAAVIVVIWATASWPSRKQHLKPWLTLSYWWNTSTRQDYLLILLNSLIFIGSAGFWLVVSISMANWAFIALSSLSPAAELATSTSLTLLVSYSIVLFLAEDLSRYGLHKLLHSRWLWRIHAVHHSASILTPFSLFRVHPLEKLLYQLRSSCVHGLMIGIFFYGFGVQQQAWQLFGISGFVLLFNIFGANLRHSMVPISFGKLEHFLISPVQHQLHHSPGYSRQNLGSVLAIWDKLFGTWTQANNEQTVSLPKVDKPLLHQLLLKR